MCENGYKSSARTRDTSFVMEFQRPINEFAVKELAIISLNYDVPPIVFLFGSPIPWSDLPAKYKSVNLWLERNYHHLPWSAGELSYNDVGNVLRLARREHSRRVSRRKNGSNSLDSTYAISWIVRRCRSYILKE